MNPAAAMMADEDVQACTQGKWSTRTDETGPLAASDQQARPPSSPKVPNVNGSIADDRVVDVPSPSKARNDASGACMYHPDLGYVGDGPPATEAAAASFALRAREPAFFWLYIYIYVPLA